MKEQKISTSYQGKEFSYVAQIPENSDEFAQLLGVNMLDFANKQYLDRLKKNLKGKIKDGKLKANQKAKIQEVVDSFRLILQGSPAKKELRTMFATMSEAEAAQIVAKMKESKEKATDQPEADNQS